MNAPDTELALSVRIIRMMNETESGRKRAMYLSGEGSHWMTLRDSDVELLSSVGYDKVLFLKSEHVFKTANQPLIQIVEIQKSVWQMFAAWSNSGKKFIKHGEKVKKVTEKSVEKKTAAQTPAQIMERVYANVEKLAEQDREARKASQDTDGIILTPEQIRRQEAEVLKNVVIKIDSAQENYGKMQLASMWKLRNEGLYAELLEGSGGVSDVFRAESNLYQRDYTIALAYIVDRIFVPVGALEKQGKPFTHPETGEPITVDYLIGVNGLVQKMKIASSVFSRLPDLKDRRKLLGLIVSKSVDNVKAEVGEMQKFLNSGDGDDEGSGGGGDLIPVKIETIPNSKKVKLVLEVDPAQQAAVMRLIQPLIGSITQ